MITGIGCDGCDENTGSMMMTMMTMMAVFNPLNFGLWGFVMAPMMAVLLGGIAYGMYYVTSHQAPVKVIGHSGWSEPWPKPPQEIFIKNKIVHGPLPIKILHKHSPIPTHATHPPPPHIIFAEPMHMYGPPTMGYEHPMFEYGPPKNEYDPPEYTNKKKYPSKITLKPPKNTHFAEPPMSHHTDEYFPYPPSGGPYKRKTHSKVKRYRKKPTKKSWFKLL